MSHAQFLLRMETVRKQAIEAIHNGESVNPYSDDETEYWVWEVLRKRIENEEA